jgi:biopolymer transport protein TolQ
MNATSVTPNAFDVSSTGPIVQGVLLILILSSLISWTIILAKVWSFKQAKKESDSFLDLFWNAKSLDGIFNETKNFSASPVSNVFRSGFIEFQKLTQKSQEKPQDKAHTLDAGLENVERALRRSSQTELLKLERLLPHLATIASVAPFIGLFGTVWGIMTSLQGLAGGGPATLERVAPGVSEALIATAVGLAAAIPAVVAYNQFVTRMRHFRAEMDGFSADFTNILKRSFLG